MSRLDPDAALPPLALPRNVICVAGNYPLPGQSQPPQYPTIFLKPTSGVIAAGQTVRLPRAAQQVFYEVELAVVIGATARYLARGRALEAVAGYTIANDLGDRLLEQRTSQWTSGKLFDTFTPLGPRLVSPDALGDPQRLALTTRVNGAIVQSGSTADMYFSVAELVAYISTLTTLRPGDVILTGSPKMINGQPNPPRPLRAGDTVVVAVQGIGELANPVAAEEGLIP